VLDYRAVRSRTVLPIRLKVIQSVAITDQTRVNRGACQPPSPLYQKGVHSIDPKSASYHQHSPFLLAAPSMKGSLLTLLFCHFLFLQSFASQHGRRRNLKHHLLARGSPLDQRSANPADDPLGIRDTTILDTIRERRVSNIIGGLSDTKADIPAWCVFTF
jgi:hypothetical protein